MKWFYEKNEAQAGPVSLQELISLLESGEISASTKVWRNGMAEWTPLRNADALVNEDGEELAICAHSGEVMLKSEMVPYGNDFINPEYREAFVQDLMGGNEATEYESDGIVPTDYQVQILSCLGRGWSSLVWNFWPIVGITFLISILWNAASFTGVGAFVVWVPLGAGLYLYLLRQVRRQPSQIEDAFSGFSSHCSKFMLINLVWMGIIVALYIPMIIVFVVIGSLGGQEPSTAIIIGLFVVMFIFYVGTFYFSAAWAFAAPLCAEKDLPFWTAMRASMKTYNKHFFACTLFWLVFCLINLLGALVVCIGLLITVPWTLLAAMHLFEDIFGGRREAVRAQLMK